MRFAALFRPHRRWRHMVDAYADGALDAADVRRFEAHIGTCDACRADVEAVRAIRRFMAEAPAEPAPRSFRISPSMLAAPRPEPARAPRTGVSAGAFMRASQALAGVAVLAFAFLVVVDLSGATTRDDDDGFAGAAIESADRMAGGDDDGAVAPMAATEPVPAPTPAPAEQGPNGGDAKDTALALTDSGPAAEEGDGTTALRIAQVAAAVLAVVAIGGYVVARRAREGQA